MEATTERIGQFDFEVVCVPETRDRQSRRQEALAAWLLAQWERQQEEAGEGGHLLN